MYRTISMLVVTAVLVCGAEKGSRARKAPARDAKSETMIGCVDQRGDGFILADESMKTETTLKGKAFTDDNFARYVGYKVSVSGQVDRSGGGATLNVTKIEKIGETCR